MRRARAYRRDRVRYACTWDKCCTPRTDPSGRSAVRGCLFARTAIERREIRLAVQIRELDRAFAARTIPVRAAPEEASRAGAAIEDAALARWARAAGNGRRTFEEARSEEHTS